MKEPTQATASLAAFLGIDPAGFDRSLLTEKVNSSQVHKFPRLYHTGIKLKEYFRRNDFHWAAHFVVITGKRFFKVLGENKNHTPSLERPVKEQLLKTYDQDIADLENMLQRDLSMWRM